MTPSNTVQADFFSHLKAQRLAEELAAAQKKLKEYEGLFAALHRNACEHCKNNFPEIAGAGANPTSESSLAAQVIYGVLKRPEFFLPGFPIGPHGQTFADSEPADPTSSISPPAPTVSKPSLQVKLERVWIHEKPVTFVKFSPDGRSLAVGLVDSQIESQKTHIYDVATWKRICLLTDRDATGPGRHWSLTNGLSFSPRGGRYLATGHSNGQTIIWQVRKKRVRNTFGKNDQLHISVDFSPNGRFVVSSSFNHQSGVRIWSMRDGSSVVLQDPNDDTFLSLMVKFSPDGKHVVASDANGMVRLWNVRTLKLAKKWKAHHDKAFCVGFTPNGKGLVTGSYDHTLKCWHLGQLGADDSTPVEVLKFVDHTDAICSVAISRDGRRVVSGSFDRTARIWDIVDASLQYTLQGHKEVLSVDFSPTGNYVACGGWDGKVSVWGYESSD